MVKLQSTLPILSQQGRVLLSLLAFSYLDHQRPAKACALLKVFESLHQEDPDTCLLLAWSQLQSGWAEQALQTLERAARLGASGASFHLLRARCLSSLKRNDEARRAMRAYISARSGEQT